MEREEIFKSRFDYWKKETEKEFQKICGEIEEKSWKGLLAPFSMVGLTIMNIVKYPFYITQVEYSEFKGGYIKKN